MVTAPRGKSGGSGVRGRRPSRQDSGPAVAEEEEEQADTSLGTQGPASGEPIALRWVWDPTYRLPGSGGD